MLASAAVPGILPPVEVGGEHFIDGGIVNSIPVDRAVQLGATRIFVMHVGRLDRPLEPPRWPWEVALVAFEIARRHRFLGDLASLPESVEIHVLPTGQPEAPKYNDLSALRYRVTEGVGESIERAHVASVRVPGRARALMRVPPPLVRRWLIAPLVLGAELLLIVASPVLAAASALRRCSSAGAGRCACSRSRSPGPPRT